jgi:hypothetical protein
MPAVLERAVLRESAATTIFRELVGINLADRAQVRRLIPPRGKPWRSIPLVNAYELEARCEWLSRRSIKKESKLFALRLAVAMCDLTTLEGQDTVEKVRRLCARAVIPIRPVRACRHGRWHACPMWRLSASIRNLSLSPSRRCRAQGLKSPPSVQRSHQGNIRSTSA